MKIKIKKLREDAILPTRGSKQAAGVDLYSTQEIIIWPGDTVVIPSGLAIEIPHGYFGAVYSRSGLSTKEKLRIASGTSVLDEDYRGEIGIPIYNDGDDRKKIEKGERIAQIVVQPYLPVECEEVDELSETERGINGFGSTGKN